MNDALDQLIAASIAATPDARAIEYRRRWFKWGAIQSLCNDLNTLLAALPEGAVIGLVARNRPATLAAFLSIIAGGRCVAILNPYQDPVRLALEVGTLKLCAVVADPEDWSASLLATMRSAGGLAVRTFEAGQGLRADLAGSALETLETSAIGAGPYHPVAPDSAALMLTSGTTGAPKRMPLPKSAILEGAQGVAAMSKSMGETAAMAQMAFIQHVSLVHLAGMTLAMQMALEHRQLVLLEKFSVPEWLQAIQDHKPEMTALTPTMMRMILAADVPAAMLASLKAVRSGTAPLDQETQWAFERRFGVPVLGNYGATEFCGPVASWSLDDHRKYRESKAGSVGRLMSGVAQLRVVDPETREQLATGQTGHFEVRVRRVGPDWLHTNDVGYLDEDGFVFLVGRADDAIIRGGFKVSPEIVSTALRTHPLVLDAAVLGRADERLGQVPIGFVEPKRKDAPPTEADLMAHVRAQLIAYQVPVRVLVLDELPRTPSGKVERPALREAMERHLAPAGRDIAAR